MLVRGAAILGLLACLAGAEERKERGLTQDEIKAGEFTLRSKRLAATLMVPDQPSSVYAGQRFESGGVVLR